MKSKIVRQLGAMLLAGAMLVTSGNVTTYAAEQTDESVEVEETPENENLDADTQMENQDFIIEDDESQDILYGMRRKNLKKLEEGDDYYICKENIGKKQKNVAYILLENTERNINDILYDVLKSDYMKSDAVIALAERDKSITISNSMLSELKRRNLGLKICLSFSFSVHTKYLATHHLQL